MYVLRLRSESYPGQWTFIAYWTGSKVFRDPTPHYSLQFDTFEEAESTLQAIREAWNTGEITSRGLTDERIASIEIYRLPTND